MLNVSELAEALSLVFLAEFGDKSQLVVVAMAATYRLLPVVSGAIVAFLVLNLVAVLAGAVVATWIPTWVAAVLAGLAFIGFGIAALRVDDEDGSEESASVGSSVFLAAGMTIFIAEFGDKTQLMVATLATQSSALSVWLGASLALIGTTLLGALLGNRLAERVSLLWVHRIAGALFILFGVLALFKGWTSFHAEV
ncbi:TMEM165/GDT1 family protein [Neptunomonas sp. XY-337]|uniref:TMEM165/GDT1 family protein n=1 Tax=Neptunomonas sp. XY-337 TaxID=2561897 RepID=UPI0010AAA582|nr:TMEM165/GDT1 family protein [Neptunomonas sp. XY-337]